MTTGMVMGHHDGCRVQRQRALNHHARMYLCPVHRAGEHALHGDEAVAAIEERYLEVLPHLATQPQPEERFARGYFHERLAGAASPSFENPQRTRYRPVLSPSTGFL